MSKIRTAGITIILLAVIVFVLLSNKQHLAAISVPDVQLTIPVRVQQVQRAPLANQVSLVGMIAGASDVTIVAEAEGRITAVTAEVGDQVRAGDVLFQIEDELKRAAFATAEVNYEKARRDLERYQSLHLDSTVSDTQLEGARLAAKTAEAAFITARRQLADCRVTSPIDGVITARPLDLGTRVKIGDVVANVVDIAKLKVRVQVAEKDAFRLKPKDAVEIHTDVYRDQSFRGEIATISDKADDAHTYAVEIALSNSAAHPLKAGMFARVQFAMGDVNPVLAIPRDALTGSLRDPHVYIIDEGVARLRSVVIGDQAGTLLAVEGGLREGETVVTSGQNNLRDSANVSIVE
ncbi:efflux RND transporter periplasmic adaptor subunit [candidate division KSB1 bacterium]|nr:efflux RND transporter periplasmic adaptor subunit [candidate division KSB1 bacterium]